SAETIFPESDSLVRTYCRQAAGNSRLAACAPQTTEKQKKEMPDRASLAIRHLVDVQLAAAKTELCVTVVSLSFQALSRFKVFTAYPTDDQLIHPKGLAVDLCLRAIRNSKVESRKLRG